MKRRQWLNIVVYCVGGVYTLLFFVSAALRLVYPYEVEWNEGAVLDHALRILDGKPIYTAPSLDFSAFVYTPFYYYVTALAMKIGGEGLWAGRLVSIISTLIIAWLAGKIVWRETSSTMLAVSGGMLFIAFYHITGFFYDIVRMDSLALCLVMAAIYSALYIKRGYVFAAILVVLAYFTKQQMVFVFPALLLCFWYRDKKKLLMFAGISTALILVGSFSLNWSTGGWYRFFTYTIPSMKAAGAFDTQMAMEVIPTWMLGRFGFTTLVIVIAVLMVWKSSEKLQKNWVVLFACYILSIISAAIGLGNPGGYQNVLMALAAMIAIVLPISGSAISDSLRKMVRGNNLSKPQIAAAIMLLAFLSLAYNPLGEKMLFASQKQRRAGDEFVAKLKEMPGDAWIPFHGYIGKLAGKQTHVHFMAMNDALVPHDTTSARFQREIDSSLAAGRFSAIILDEDKVFHWDTIAYYARSGEMLKLPNVFISRIGEAQTRPQFIYLPKR